MGEGTGGREIPGCHSGNFHMLQNTMFLFIFSQLFEKYTILRSKVVQKQTQTGFGLWTAVHQLLIYTVNSMNYDVTFIPGILQAIVGGTVTV